MANTTAIEFPDWLDTGDNAWQLTAATLVGLQSIPGLVVLYGGIVKRRWAVNSAFMAFYAFACVLICWVLWAYKMSFGEPWGAAPFIGRPGPVVTIEKELQQAVLPSFNASYNFPLSTMIYFQFVFAAITLVITAGAFLARMNFIAWMIYVPLWLTFSYTVVAYSIWGGGFLAVRGVLDYSGGYVIHLSSGTAGFVGAAWIGPRIQVDRDDFRPNNVLLTMVGAGILWTGWNGFNGGDPFNAGTDAAAAVLNTNITTAMSLLVWTLLDLAYFRKPSIIGSVQGMITGLVAITPAAGFVAGWSAIVIGILSGSIPWVSMNIVGKKWALLRRVDDTLGVVHTHMVAGFVGGMCSGIFATGQGNLAFAAVSPGGATTGHWKQLYIQLYSALFVIAVNIFMTSIIMAFIKYVCRVPLRMSDADCLLADSVIHGEDAYAFGEWQTRARQSGVFHHDGDQDLETGEVGHVTHPPLTHSTSK